jgi:predicted ester cyclase
VVDPKKVVRDFYASYEDRDLDATFNRYIPADLMVSALGTTLPQSEWLSYDKALISACPDLHFEIFDQVSEGNTVATRYAMIGTHTGTEFFGIQATGNKGTMPGISFDRITDDGKWAERHAAFDFNAFLKQLSGESDV